MNPALAGCSTGPGDAVFDQEESTGISMDPFGFTRSRICHSYALIAPPSQVEAPLPNWINSSGVILISPRMGAGFCQFAALMGPESAAAAPAPGIERFVFVEQGRCTLDVAGSREDLAQGGFAFIPADCEHLLASTTGCRLTVFEKPYVPLAGVSAPPPVSGREQTVSAEPFMGDPDAMLKTLLPDAPEFDLAVNLFEFAPGAALPMVEVHVMEHGLLMVQGKGIYRLGDDWHPVQRGDVIWMAPFCPQWFTAVGKEPARYLYYKDVGRNPLGSSA